VDNGSTDKTILVARGFPEVKVLSESSKGPTFARRRGFMEAKNEFVAFIDADKRMPRGWFAKAKEEFDRDPHLVCLSGPFRYYDLPPFQKFFAELLWSVTAPATYWMVGFMALTANVVIKREALKKAGGFDTTIAFYGDDTNLAWRLSKVGKVKFKMSFFIFGSGRRLTQDGLIKTFFLYGINYIWMALWHTPFTKQYNDVR
jgi:GT2 family glycosyltransferase